VRTPPSRNFRLTLLILVGAVAGAYLAFGIATAKQTLGCDFEVYRAAADRFLAGETLYSSTATSTGSCNLFYYPPSFVALVVPFALLGVQLGNAAWIAFLVAGYVVGCAVLPVRWEIKLGIFLAGAVSWPFIFGVRIGQVAPILYLLFAAGWRSLERRPAVTGFVVGLGVLLKLQPIVIVGWLVIRRMWSGLAGVAVAGAVALLLAIIGLGGWVEMVNVLRNLENAITAPTNVSLGAIAYQHGLSLELASMLGIGGILAVLGLVVVCGLRSSAEAGFLVAVVASQVVSPIIWTHYALILLLPVAWLLQRRQWWAALIPVSQAWVLLPFMPIEIYPIGFYLALIAVPLVDWRERRRSVAGVIYEHAGA
jgi:alpha-1,2-mannosyltransferase